MYPEEGTGSMPEMLRNSKVVSMAGAHRKERALENVKEARSGITL